MSDSEQVEYSDDFVTKMELLFGPGFLSPGGSQEVAKIVEGIEIKGKEVLDIGVGAAGPACVLVNELGASHVVGIDVEEPVLRRAAATVTKSGLDDRVSLKLVAPGPLPFADASFDVVFSKDSIIHVPDKRSLFIEVLRVLKPGGWVVMSDWYCSDQPFTAEMSEWLDSAGLSFAISPIQNDGSLLAEAGFEDSSILDRNAWFADFSAELVERLGGPDYGTLVATLGQADADELLSRSKMRAVISAQGQLRPGHIRGRKPL